MQEPLKKFFTDKNFLKGSSSSSPFPHAQEPQHKPERKKGAYRQYTGHNKTASRPKKEFSGSEEPENFFLQVALRPVLTLFYCPVWCIDTLAAGERYTTSLLWEPGAGPERGALL